MFTINDLNEMKNELSEIQKMIWDVEKELKSQEIKPFEIAKRVRTMPYRISQCGFDGHVNEERILISDKDDSVWRLLSSVAKELVATCEYVAERRKIYSSNYPNYTHYVAKSNYTNKFTEMSEQQLDAVVDFLNDAVNLYNHYFLKLHDTAKVTTITKSVKYVPIVTTEITG